MSGKTGARPSEPAKSPSPARKAAPKPQREEPPAAPAPAEPEPTAHRAGGWVDRGDGRGWELDDEAES